MAEKPSAKKPSAEILNATILGVTELAAFLGVQSSTTHVWGYRDQLPPPDFEHINGVRAWKRITIVKWAAETDRLPAWLKSEGAPYIPEGGYKRPRRTKAEMEVARAAEAAPPRKRKAPPRKPNRIVKSGARRKAGREVTPRPKKVAR